jgi:hypothetical protein
MFIGKKMKKILSNLVVLTGLALVFTLYTLHRSENPGYWEFLTHPMILNVSLAFIGMAIGLIVKDYAHILLGSTLVLAIYVCFAFDAKNSEMNQFFPAIYTIFLAFSLLANTFKLFKDWLIAEQ